MAWPEGEISTTNTDQGTDNPQQARADILAMMLLVNQMLAARPMTQDGAVVFAGTAGGTANALTATLVPTPEELTDGMHIIVRASAANTSSAVTLNLNGLGALAVRKRGGVNLVAGNVYGVGHMLVLAYHASGSRWELLNPFEPGVTSVAPGTYVATTITIDSTGRISAIESGSPGYSNIAEWRNPGTFSWTVPAGVTRVKCRVWAAGASGAGGVARCGGAGGYGERYCNVSPGQVITIVVGAGGAAANAGSLGANGGTSSFGSFVTCVGGSRSTNIAADGAGGTVSGAQFARTGGAGTSQRGGDAFGASGGVAVDFDSIGPAGQPGAYPGGGGGRGDTTSPYSPGGAGANGCVIVDY